MTSTIEKLEKETNRLFHGKGMVQSHLDEIEDGLWRGRKVEAWNTIILPCGVAEEQVLNDLRSTYQKLLERYLELNQQADSLQHHYSLGEPCPEKQRRLVSIFYELERGSRRLADFCTTARTGIPFSSWGNRNEIKCLDLLPGVAVPSSSLSQSS